MATQTQSAQLQLELDAINQKIENQFQRYKAARMKVTDFNIKIHTNAIAFSKQNTNTLDLLWTIYDNERTKLINIENKKRNLYQELS